MNANDLMSLGIIIPGTKLRVSGVFTLIRDVYEITHASPNSFIVTPPVHCYGCGIQLHTMALALAKVAYIEGLKNKAKTDMFLAEALESSVLVVVTNEIIQVSTEQVLMTSMYQVEY